MNTTTTILIPLFTASMLLSTSTASTMASDISISGHTDEASVARTVQARFVPVPYRQMHRSNLPVRIATLQGEQARSSRREQRPSQHIRTAGSTGFIKQAVMKRVADFRSNQTKDVLVPQPRDLFPTARPDVSVERSTVQVDSRTYVPASNVRRREHINSYSTLGVRAYH